MEVCIKVRKLNFFNFFLNSFLHEIKGATGKLGFLLSMKGGRLVAKKNSIPLPGIEPGSKP
jgi:hypothetical protein